MARRPSQLSLHSDGSIDLDGGGAPPSAASADLRRRSQDLRSSQNSLPSADAEREVGLIVARSSAPLFITFRRVSQGAAPTVSACRHRLAPVRWSACPCMSTSIESVHQDADIVLQGDASVSRYARQLEAKVEKLEEMLQREMRRSAGLPSPYAPASIAQGTSRCVMDARQRTSVAHYRRCPMTAL